MKLNLFLEMSFWGQIFIFKTARILTHIWKGLLLPSIWLLRLKKSQNSSNFPFWSRSNFRAFYSYWMEYEINSSILNNICWENSLTILKANLFRNISEPAFMLFLTMPYYCLHWSIVRLVKIAWLSLMIITLTLHFTRLDKEPQTGEANHSCSWLSL